MLGDKLNSDKLEFGIDGGINFCNISNLDESKMRNAFNLGFYFDFKLSNHLLLHTGVLVKSSLGAKEINFYSLDNSGLDNILSDGDVQRKISNFNVPILLKYRFATFFHVEAGPMLGHRTSVKDEFRNSIIDDDDLNYKLDIKDKYKRIDAGVMGGVGFKLSKIPKSAQAGIRYYYGLIDPLKDNTGNPQYNSSLYLYVSIPIGGNTEPEKLKETN